MKNETKFKFRRNTDDRWLWKEYFFFFLLQKNNNDNNNNNKLNRRLIQRRLIPSNYSNSDYNKTIMADMFDP